MGRSCDRARATGIEIFYQLRSSGGRCLNCDLEVAGIGDNNVSRITLRSVGALHRRFSMSGTDLRPLMTTDRPNTHKRRGFALYSLSVAELKRYHPNQSV